MLSMKSFALYRVFRLNLKLNYRRFCFTFRGIVRFLSMLCLIYEPALTTTVVELFSSSSESTMPFEELNSSYCATCDYSFMILLIKDCC